MGIKGSMHTEMAQAAADHIVDSLGEIEDIESKKMFGGHGIFHAGTMFGIIDSEGVAFLRADNYLKSRFEVAGSMKHDRMPYYSIPDSVLKDPVQLLQWARDSLRASKG